jgi:urease accessory protein
MGTSAARISAADFLTPPELSDRRLAAEGAGRIGGVRLELEEAERGARSAERESDCVSRSALRAPRSARTRLTGCYQQVPLRVLPAFQLSADEPALVYLLNPTAGLMDGDAQLVSVHAGTGSRALLVGQSATRIHPCLRYFSTQQWHIRVESGAVLAVLPGPTIPFRNCRYFQHVDIELAAGAGLVWGDIWLAGRYAHGDTPEQFQFTTLIQELTVRRDDELVFRDRFCWSGPWDAPTAAWHFGASPACGSLFATGPVQENTLHANGSSAMAHFPTAWGDTCLRWSGSSESVTACVVRSAMSLACRLAGGTSGRAWLLPGHDLAPNHWFSRKS